MAAVYYYADDSGQQNGPVGEETIFELIRGGGVRAETLVWTAGMSDWARADSVAAFAARLVRPPAAPPSPARAAPAAAPSAAPEEEGRLIGALPVWGLFWRSIVVTLGVILIVPAPWAGVWFYKWFASHVILPGDRPLRLQASVGDSWLLFVGLGLNEWIGSGFNLGPNAHWGSLIAAILGLLLSWALMRWFCGRLATDDGATKLAFKGGLLGLLGWYVLLALSFVTVIGWAWVAKFFYRWLAAKAEGAPRFACHATGLAILWRTILLAFGSAFIIPIPWLARWYVNWTISQFSVEPAANG
jgi:hypothetical protein